MPNQWHYINTSHQPPVIHPVSSPDSSLGKSYGFTNSAPWTKIQQRTLFFHKRLLNCRYKTEKLLPLIEKGINKNAINYLSLSLEQWEAKKKTKTRQSNQHIFLHLPYHPQNPTSNFIQCHWQDLVFLPPGQEELTKLTNWEGHLVPIKRLIVAYLCNPNLANLNLYHKLSMRTELKPSFILHKWLEQSSPDFFSLCAISLQTFYVINPLIRTIKTHTLCVVNDNIVKHFGIRIKI